MQVEAGWAEEWQVADAALADARRHSPASTHLPPLTHRHSPWWQTPAFDEYALVLQGSVTIETTRGPTTKVSAGPGGSNPKPEPEPNPEPNPEPEPEPEPEPKPHPKPYPKPYPNLPPR